MENRFKEQQLELFSDRTSTHTFAGNQLRLWFSSVAYVLMNALRQKCLAQTELQNATVCEKSGIRSLNCTTATKNAKAPAN